MTEAPEQRLAARFLALLTPDRRAGLRPELVAAPLAAAVEAGRAAWPGVSLADETFVAHLAARLADAPAILSALGAVHAADLYLACACAAGDPSAIGLFDQHVLPVVGRAWAAGHRLADFADEVRQSLRIRLLVGIDGPPRIASYTGRGPLAAWVRVAATRLALDLRRQKRPESGGDEDEVASLRAPGPDPELEYLKTRYATELGEALRATLDALSSRTANVLRLHYQEGMTVDAIGTMYRVSGRTVQRWLAEARRTILGETRRLLSERLGLDDSRLESLIGLVRSRLDVSIYEHLRAPTGAG